MQEIGVHALKTKKVYLSGNFKTQTFYGKMKVQDCTFTMHKLWRFTDCTAINNAKKLNHSAHKTLQNITKCDICYKQTKPEEEKTKKTNIKIKTKKNIDEISVSAVHDEINILNYIEGMINKKFLMVSISVNDPDNCANSYYKCCLMLRRQRFYVKK